MTDLFDHRKCSDKIENKKGKPEDGFISIELIYRHL